MLTVSEDCCEQIEFELKLYHDCMRKNPFFNLNR